MERPTAPSPSASRVASVVAGLSRFSASQGLGATPPLCREMVEAYCAIGLARRASSTRGTYRSVLRAAAEKLERRPAAPYPGAPAPAPYAPAERAALQAMSLAQPRAWLAHSARVVLAFCIGAGLRPGELCRLVGTDVTTTADGVVVSVAGRTVTVRPPDQATAAALARAAGGGYLFHPGEAARSYKNFVN